jgi:hypothetical protein
VRFGAEGEINESHCNKKRQNAEIEDQLSDEGRHLVVNAAHSSRSDFKLLRGSYLLDNKYILICIVEDMCMLMHSYSYA